MKLKDTYSLEESYEQLRQHIKKQRPILSTKVCLLKVMVFPVVMYGCESWTIKKAEHQRIDAFVLWCWRRLLRVPWTTRRSNQSILKEISPGCSLEDWCWGWNSNPLATWWEKLTHLKRPWCWERLRAGGEGDDRVWDGWMASPTHLTWVWVDSESWWGIGRPGMLHAVHGITKSQTRLNDWTEWRHIKIYRYVHLCLFFCFAYRVIITIFLNSIYMCYHTVMVFIFLAYFTLYNGLQFHPSH